MNVVVLMGRLGKRPEVKQSRGGSAVCSFGLAVQTRVKVDGEWKSETDWHDIVCFGRQAEWLGDVDKGDEVMVQGKLRKREWTDKAGQVQRRTEVVAEEVKVFARRVTVDTGGATF